MTSSSVSVVAIVLSFSSVVLSDPSWVQKLQIPGERIGPESFAFDSSGNGFYTGVSGGKILKYSYRTGFADFAQTSRVANEPWCGGTCGTMYLQQCGKPVDISLNEGTQQLYIADATLGLHVVSLPGGLATKIVDSVNGEPFVYLSGLDIDPTTGVIYFTSLSLKFKLRDMLSFVFSDDSTGRLFKYDPMSKTIIVLIQGLSGSAGCVVSADGSFVLVSEFKKGKIIRYWIKDTNVGKIDEFMTNIPNSYSIKRTGSSGNFWVASSVDKPTIMSFAVKVDNNGKVLQTISLTGQFGNTMVSEANEFNGFFYVGTWYKPHIEVLKL